MKLKGIGSSPGISIAKVLIIKNNKIKINNDLIKEPEKEKNKINNAINSTIEDIKKIKCKVKNNLSQEEIAIFDAHIQVAKDPEILKDIFKLIDEKKYNAAFAVKKINDKYIDMFSNIDNDYMKERISDINDVSKRIINNLLGIKEQDLSKILEKVIIVAHDLTPSQTALLNKKYIKGIATDIGGVTSHAAIMARSLEIPTVLGLKNISEKVNEETLIALDGEKGNIIINPNDQEIKLFKEKEKKFKNEIIENQKYKNKKSTTLDGKKFKLVANIGSSKDIENVLKNGAEGVGLFRTEFVYMDSKDWPTEQEQFEIYKYTLEKMKDKKVIIRTLDIGGDKKLKYHNFSKEINPFLGYRAIRFCLGNLNIFKTQIRALLRASIFGNLAIMFPMIATINEFLKAKKIVTDCQKELENEGFQISKKYEIGMMVEIPSAAILINKFAKHSDFFSIGTNDLMQYSMAADRMNENVSYLYQPLNPSILNIINLIIKNAHLEKKWVGMCGEMVGDKNVIPILVGMGLDELSMSPTSILRTRRLIASIDFKKANNLVKKVLNAQSQEEVAKLVKNFNIY